MSLDAHEMRRRAADIPDGRLQALLALHHRDGLRCAEDLKPWPCPTRYILGHTEDSR